MRVFTATWKSLEGADRSFRGKALFTAKRIASSTMNAGARIHSSRLERNFPAIQEKDRWAAAADYLVMNGRKSRFGMPTSIDTVAAGLRAPRLSVSL